MTRILVVDDSPVDLKRAAGLLARAADWDIHLAGDGEEALCVVGDARPDVVVTDLLMPGMNGLELVSAIRQQYSQTPVILMTGMGSEEIAIEALRSGAASYVPKRILASELMPTVRRILSQASEGRSLAALMNRLHNRAELYRVETDLALMMTLSRHLQQQVGDVWHLQKTDRLRIGTAIEEALLNAFYHGSLEVSSQLKEADYASFYELANERLLLSPYKDRFVEVELAVTPLMLSIVIRDQGPGFDPSTLPDPTDIENLDRPCGRGVMLMRSFMDEVRYNAAGNEVTLVKRRFPGEPVRTSFP